MSKDKDFWDFISRNGERFRKAEDFSDIERNKEVLVLQSKYEPQQDLSYALVKLNDFKIDGSELVVTRAKVIRGFYRNSGCEGLILQEFEIPERKNLGGFVIRESEVKQGKVFVK